MEEPRRIWWARPRKLCALERPGGGGRSHRPERREAEIAWAPRNGARGGPLPQGPPPHHPPPHAAGLEGGPPPRPPPPPGAGGAPGPPRGRPPGAPRAA